MDIVVDIIVFSLAFTIISSSIMSYCRKAVSLQVFAATLLVESAYVEFGLQMFSLLPVMTVAAFLLYRQGKKLYAAFFTSLLTVILLTIGVTAAAIPLSAFMTQGGLYNYIMSFMVMLYSLLCQLFIRKHFPSRTLQGTIMIILDIIGMLIVVFISIIAPLFLPYNIETLPFFILFTIFLVFVVVFFVYALKTETEKNRQEYNKLIEKQYKEISQFRHYYNKLYRSMNQYVLKKDMAGIEEIFRQHIIPEHVEHIEKGIDYGLLALVKLPLINGLLFDTSASMRQKGIPLNLHIEGMIVERNIKELDLFKILACFIENAIQEAEGQENGYINIFLCEGGEGMNMRVENTLESDINISLIYQEGYTTKENHAGSGLPEVRRIADSYPNVSLSTERKFGLFIQNITIE